MMKRRVRSGPFVQLESLTSLAFITLMIPYIYTHGETNYQMGIVQKWGTLCHFFCFNLCYLQGFPPSTLSEWFLPAVYLPSVTPSLSARHPFTNQGIYLLGPLSMPILSHRLSTNISTYSPPTWAPCLCNHLNHLPTKKLQPSTFLGTSTVYLSKHPACLPYSCTLVVYLLSTVNLHIPT